MASPLRIFQGDDAPMRQPPPGYAKASREVNSTHCKALSSRAKVVLYAIVGSCFNDSRVSYITLSSLATSAGYKLRATQKGLSELESSGYIVRERDPERAGCPWRTTILINPSGVSKESPPTPSPSPEIRIATRTMRARQRARCVRVNAHDACASVYRQGILFPITTMTEELSSSSQSSVSPDPLITEAVRLFPQLGADDTPARSLLAAHGALLFEAALALVQRARRKSGGSSPEKIRWLVVVLENYQSDISRGVATVESIRNDAGIKPAPVQPVPVQPEPAEPTGPILSADELARWKKAIVRGDMAEAEAILSGDRNLYSAQEIGRVPSAKITTRPIGAYESRETIIQQCANDLSETQPQCARKDSKSAHCDAHITSGDFLPPFPEKSTDSGQLEPEIETTRGFIIRDSEPL